MTSGGRLGLVLTVCGIASSSWTVGLSVTGPGGSDADLAFVAVITGQADPSHWSSSSSHHLQGLVC